MIRILVLIISLSLAGCSNDGQLASGSDDSAVKSLNDSIIDYPNTIPSNFDLEHSVPNVPYGLVRISYETFDKIRVDVEKKNRKENLSAQESQEAISGVPNGGWFEVTIYRKGDDGQTNANTENFEFTVLVDGVEVQREVGQASNPDKLVDGNYWTSDFVVFVEQSVDTASTIELIVSDNVNNVNDEFLLTRK